MFIELRECSKLKLLEETNKNDKSVEKQEDNDASFNSKKSDVGSQGRTKKIKFGISKNNSTGRIGSGPGGMAS
jgi:hypothetical protein